MPLKSLSKTAKAFHSKKYAERHTTKMQEADDWYQSVYGTGTAHRTGVLTAVPMDMNLYQVLPEEIDAYIVGPKAKAKFQQLMNNP